MRRAGKLIEQIADIDNLRLAFHKAQQGKSGKQDVVAYRENLEQNLYDLRWQLLAGKAEVGKYRLFKIYDPKERTVCAAAFRERVLHHALMNICAPYFERHFIATTYANRTGKGVYKALERAHKAMGRYKYVAKLDVRKYFDNIDHAVLMCLLRRLFKDEKLLAVLQTIIGSYEVTPDRGLPIGNLTSQYFANYNLSALDHHAKEELGIPVFLRYMDDMLLFGNERTVVQQQVEALCRYAETKLLLQMKPPQIQQTAEGVTFLGYRLRGRSITMTTRSKRRLERKYRLAEKNLNSGVWSEQEYQAHVMPLFAFAQHGYTKHYRQNIIQKVSVVGLQPRESGRQLEQQCNELPGRES